MGTSIAVSNIHEAQLTKALAHLQQSASVVAAQTRSLNMALYAHLAQLYVWWRAASTVEGYLDSEYKKIGKRRPKPVSYGINFSPLFRITWGYDNGLSDDRCRRWSIVLNKLHDLYEAEQQYQTDTVAKFQTYIHVKGGVDGIVNDGKFSPTELDDDELSDEEVDAKRADEPPRLSIEEKIKLLYGTAKQFYETVPGPVTLGAGHVVPVTDDGLGIVLVRKTGKTYQLVGASNDDEVIRPLLMQTFLNDFSALPASIRTLVELISTQCLPELLQPMYDALVDPAVRSAGDGANKAVRRAMYRHDRQMFILSPLHSDSGVVTTARPVQPVLENASCDAFVSTRCRRAIERRLVSGRDFNLYATAQVAQIPEYAYKDLATHSIRIQDRFAGPDYLHVDFLPFHSKIPTPRGQLIAKEDIAGSPVWSVVLEPAWFRKFALEFTMPWVRSHGTHIRREHQGVMQLDFSDAAMTLNFVYRDGEFEVDHKVEFDGAHTSGEATSVCVLSKDFIVAMQAIADLGVLSGVDLTVNDHVLALEFYTGAAQYRQYIPTCTLDQKRNSTAFEFYEPPPFVFDESKAADFELFNDQLEGDFDEAR